MEKQTIYLDASMLAGRMRSHRTRPVSRVVARGNPQHLRKHLSSDMWIPSDVTVKFKEPSTKRPQTPISLAKQSSNSQAKLDTIQEKLNFAANAEVWKKNAGRSKKRYNLPCRKLLNTNGSLTSMAVALFIVGIAAAVHSFKVDKQITATVEAQSISDAEIDETKPTDEDIQNYKVAPEMPRYIHLPKFDTSARVRAVGLNEKGELDAPKNIHDAAWYNDSVLPGSPGGASIIDGHISGPTQPGVFKYLDKLNAGDTVIVKLGNGKNINYKVVKKEISDVNKLDMTKMLLPVTAGKHGLNLISCTGKYNTQTKQYEQRVMIFTEAVQ